MNGLYLSCLLHVGHTVYSFNKDRRFTVHNIISLWFSFVVIMGIISVQFDIYQAVHGEINKLDYEPYIYEFIGFLIFIWPFKLLDKNQQLLDMPDINKQLKIVIGILVVLFSMLFLLNVKVYFYISQYDYVDSYYSLQDTGETLYKYNWYEEKIAWICGSAYRWFAPLLIIYIINMMINDKTGKKIPVALFYLFIVFGCKLLTNISRGGRGGVFWFIILMIFVFLPFFKQLSKPSRRVLLKIVPIFIGLSLAYAMIMSVMRTENSSNETPFTQVVRYLGEPYPHFGNAFWEEVRIHPMGVRMFPMLLSGTNFNESYDYAETWEAVMEVPIMNYPTMYGDFYCEFGKIGALIAITIFSFIFYLFVRKKPYTFSKYPIIYFYFQIAVTGPYWFSQRGNVGVLSFIAVILMYFIIEVLIRRKKQITF